jgi:hypothetical protein
MIVLYIAYVLSVPVPTQTEYGRYVRWSVRACLLARAHVYRTYRTYACMCTHAESFKIADEAAELAAALSVASSHHMYAGDGDGGHTLTPAARRSGTHAISTLCRYMYV